MTDGRSRSHDSNLAARLTCVIALGLCACAPSRSNTMANGGTGGDNGSGGILSGGGNQGSGGVSSGAGGDPAGGVTGSGGTGSAGSSGSGGAPPSNIACTSETDCTPTGQHCETVTKLCAPCTKTAECAAGAHCLGNQCVTFTPCSSKAECSGGSPVCDTARGVCVQCTADTDCGSAQSCYANKCVAVATCKNNGDCSTGLCDTANNECIDCLVDSHCNSSSKHCVRNVCRPACTSNADCAASGMVCDTSNSVCVQCLTVKECPASSYCLMNVCVADVCDSSESACSGTSVAGCSSDGDAFNNFTSCTTAKPCTAKGAVATCGGVAVRDGGVSDAPTSTSDASVVSTCSLGTAADPCKTGIPKFTGTQTVDGNGSELCTVPYFVLNAGNATKLINYSNAPTSQFETATVRVAADSAGMHVLVEVQDTSIQTAYMADASQAVSKTYLGDSVELFFSSSSSVTGLTSKDSNTLHIIIPANGPAVSVKDTGSSGTPTALPTTQYAQSTTATGYAVEALIPWPGSAPSTGTAIRFDLALNSADKSFSGIDNMRDGQLIYYIGSVSSSTCQTSDGTVPWCDDRTWCQANLL